MSSIYDRLGTLQNAARVRLLRLLELEELSVGEIANVVQMPQSTVSRHLKALMDDGWLERRRDGTASLFAVANELPEDAGALWQIVSSATDGDHAEDGLRLASVLAARQVDSRAFFGRVGGGWSELRRELFGDAFLLPSMLALLPSHWTVADLGCGPGELVAMLAPTVGRVIGVDREPAMLHAAAEHTQRFGNVDLREGSLEAPPLAVGELDAAIGMLVLHHVASPAAVLAGVRPALKATGHLVLVDMVDHDRDEYRRTMGHQHLGFSESALAEWGRAAGLRLSRYDVLPPAPSATGPALFVAVMEPT